MMTEREFKEWCIEQHESTNHKYDKYLPYAFHLRMVVIEVSNHHEILMKDIEHQQITAADVVKAAWGHDLIEDCRVNYNDIKERVGTVVADLVFAVTDCRGKTRSQRHDGEYWNVMHYTPAAKFLKLCDRLANVRYSKMMNNSNKLDMYRKEQEVFRTEIETPELTPMLDELEELLK